MKRYIKFAFILIPIYGSPSIAPAEEQGIALDKLRVTRDRAISSNRLNCADGGIHQVERGARERGFQSPPTEIYCQTVLDEVAKRGMDIVFYHILGDGNANAAFEAVTQAAMRGDVRVTKPSGKTIDLSCGLAFDAGHVFGHQWPDNPLAASLTAERAKEISKDCYAERPSVSTHDGFLAGAWFGRNRPLKEATASQ